MPYQFRYLPLTGPLSGRSFEKQTELAFNEIGNYAYDASETADKASKLAQEASKTAGDAKDIANDAITLSRQANEAGTQALHTAQEALTTANTASATATSAMTKADLASAVAENANTVSTQALDTAQKADMKAQTAIDTADTASGTANQAISATQQFTARFNQVVYYENEAAAIDADTCLDSVSLRIDHTDNLHLPVNETGFLTVRRDLNSSRVFQLFQTDDNVLFSRTGEITAQNNAGTDNVVIEWNGEPAAEYTLTIDAPEDYGPLQVTAFSGSRFTVEALTVSSFKMTLVFPVASGTDGQLVINRLPVVTVTGATPSVTDNKVITPNGSLTALSASATDDGLTVVFRYYWTNTSDFEPSGWSEWIEVASQNAVDTKQDILTFDSTPTADSANPVTSAGIKTAIEHAISTVYKWKGNVDIVSALPDSGNAIGDVYNVVASGANYAWTGTAWDNLGGIDAVDTIPVKDSVYPVSSGGVFNALATKQDNLTFDATPTAGSSNPVTSGGVKSAIDSAISTVYKWQGSVNTVADLPSSGNAVGDVYNVVSSGANYGWTGSAWDNLGGIDAVDAVPVKDSAYPVASGGVFDALATKQDKLTIDAAPVTGSTNPVASGGVADALSKIQESLVFDDTPTAGSTNPVTSQGIKTALDQLAVNGAGAPVGTIQYFAMDAPPAGYLKADGTLISRTVYADLFAAIGTTYGAGDGTTTFALPDLRGEFVRGFDDGRGVDSSRVFGSTQGDAQYPLSDQRITQLERFPATDPVTTADAAAFGYRLETSAAMASRPSVSVCGFAPDEGDTVAIMDLVPFNTNPVADEVRPRNVALLACIKAFGVIDNTGSVDLSTLASKDEVAKKQDKLTFDTAPTENSANPVTSGGVYTAIQNSVNAVDLSGYWNTTASGTGVVDHSFLQADAQTASAKTVTLTKQSTKSINLTTSGAVTLDIQAGNETDTAFITLNIQAEAATSLTWPSSVIWIDPDAQAPTWGNAGSFLHVQLCLARTRILASTLYNSEA